MSARDLIPNPFDFEGQSVRVVEINGELQFHAGDVCTALGFANSRQALETHVEEDDVQKLDAIDSMGRTQLANHINEPGLYALTMGATKDVAKRFKHWVTHDVLPSIRKTGGYTMPAPQPQRATGGNKSLDSFRQARALEITKNVAGDLCAMFPDLGHAAQQTIYAKLINNVAGADVVPLPAVGRLYSATEIAKKYGSTPQAVGKLANANNLKVEKYGEYVLDKSRSSVKEMSNFLYNEAGVTRIGELMGRSAKPAPGGQAQLGFDPPAG